MRAVIYARYSSDNQRDASIEDQIRLCRKRVDREGYSLTEVYTDHAVSGATTLRPGYQKLLEDARNGAFDIVIAEALDRLSRDQEDVAGLYKQLSFAGVTMLTVLACPRRVSGTPARAGTPVTLLTPGTTPQGMPAR